MYTHLSAGTDALRIEFFPLDLSYPLSCLAAVITVVTNSLLQFPFTNLLGKLSVPFYITTTFV